MLNIHIVSIPHKDQNYNTSGDWKFIGDSLCISVSELNNWKQELCVAIHEIIEAALCKARGIKEDDVTSWDLKHLDSDDPGDLKNAIYRKEHLQAETVERMVASFLELDWSKYDRKIELLYKKGGKNDNG